MMRRLISLFLAIIFWLSTPSVSLAQNNINNLDNLPLEKVQELISIRHSITTIDELQKRDVLSETQAITETKYYLEKSQLIVGEKLSLEEIIQLTNNYEIVTPGSQRNIIQRIAGFVTLTNITLTVAAILLVLAVGWLGTLYLAPIVKLIPLWVYQTTAYLVCFAAIIGGKFLTEIGEFIAFPGCLGLIAAIKFNDPLYVVLKKFFDRKIYSNYLDYSNHFYSLILFIIWAIAAIVYQSSLLGFITIIALEVFLGLAMEIIPFYKLIFFTKDDVISRGMFVSLILLILYVSSEIVNVELPYIGIFSTGVLFVGSFVYFVGTLIVSSKWYNGYDVYKPNEFNINRYLWLQLLTVVSGIAALYIGSVWQVLLLQRIGGTFFFLYLIGKYSELPWEKKTAAWATLGLAIILYLSALVAKQYPEYFFLVN